MCKQVMAVLWRYTTYVLADFELCGGNNTYLTEENRQDPGEELDRQPLHHRWVSLHTVNKPQYCDAQTIELAKYQDLLK